MKKVFIYSFFIIIIFSGLVYGQENTGVRITEIEM